MNISHFAAILVGFFLTFLSPALDGAETGICSCKGWYPVANRTNQESWYRCMEFYPLTTGDFVASPGYVHTMVCDNPITGDEMQRGGLKNVVLTAPFVSHAAGITREACASRATAGFEAPYQLSPVNCIATSCGIRPATGGLTIPMVFKVPYSVNHPWQCEFVPGH